MDRCGRFVADAPKVRQADRYECDARGPRLWSTLFRDKISFAAASIVGAFRPRLGPSPRGVFAAASGGLTLGYGAHIAFGCNASAFFSSVANTNHHGRLGIAAACRIAGLVRLLRRFSLRRCGLA